MNKNCVLCNGKYNFDSIIIKNCLNEATIAFTGGNGRATQNNCFKFCPACGERLTADNFGGKDLTKE